MTVWYQGLIKMVVMGGKRGLFLANEEGFAAIAPHNIVLVRVLTVQTPVNRFVNEIFLFKVVEFN